MKRLIIISSILLLSSCMKNFNPDTDSELGTVMLSVDLMPTFEEFKSTDLGSMNLRVRAYCYGEDGLLKKNLSCSPADFNDKVAFEFRHLQKEHEYRFMVFADFYSTDASGSEEDIWFHLLTGSQESFHIKRVSGSNGFYDIIGTASMTHMLKDPKAEITMPLQHAGVPCRIVFTNPQELTEIYHSYTGSAVISPTGNEKYSQTANFFQTYTVTGQSDPIGFNHYIIPDKTGKSAIEYKLTYINGTDAAQDTKEIDVTAGVPVVIEINCLNGEMTCTNI